MANSGNNINRAQRAKNNNGVRRDQRGDRRRGSSHGNSKNSLINSWSSWLWTRYTFVTLSSILIGFISVYYFDGVNHGSSWLPSGLSSSSTAMNISQVLRMSVEVCEELLNQEYQLKAFLLNDPIADLMKRSLRPIQEKVSSLRTQSAQYETMEHIPGGPTHFISSAQKELLKLEEQLLMLTDEVHELAEINMRKFKNLQKGAMSAIQGSLILIEPEALELFGSVGIPVAPEEYSDDPEFVTRLAKGRTLEEVLALFSRLAGLFEKGKAEQDKLDDTLMKYGINGLEELEDITEISPELLEVATSIEEHDRKIENEILRNADIYQLFLPLKGILNTKLAKTMETIQNYLRGQVSPYMSMKNILIKDIQQLQIRVDNLKYKYAKRSTEI